jgi:hypothetical protein
VRSTQQGLTSVMRHLDATCPFYHFSVAKVYLNKGL